MTPQLNLGQCCASGETIGNRCGTDTLILFLLRPGSSHAITAEHLHDCLPEVLVDNTVKDKVCTEVDCLECVHYGDP